MNKSELEEQFEAANSLIRDYRNSTSDMKSEIIRLTEEAKSHERVVSAVRDAEVAIEAIIQVNCKEALSRDVSPMEIAEMEKQGLAFERPDDRLYDALNHVRKVLSCYQREIRDIWNKY